MYRRLGTLALVTLVAISGAAGDDRTDGSGPSETPAATPPAPLVEGLRIALDPDTGTLTDPTPAQAERLALELDRVLGRARPARVRTFRYPDGTVAAAVPARLMSFSVVRMGPDGTLEHSCEEHLAAPSDPEDRP